MLRPFDRRLLEDACRVTAVCTLQRKMPFVIAGSEHFTVAEKAP
jgi:hypothetical protein